MPVTAEAQPMYRKTLRHFNVPGEAHFVTFSTYRRQPFLTNDLYRAWLAESVRTACAKDGWFLWAYVFMPEHVHLLVFPRQTSYSVAEFLRSVKLPFARRLVASLLEKHAPLLVKLTVPARPGHGVYRVWQAGAGYDKNLWSWDWICAKARYCHRNPVTRRLVRSPEKWRWSSFRWLELGVRKNEPLEIDDWVEVGE